MDYYYPVCFGGLVAVCAALLVSQPTRRLALERQAEPPKKFTSRDEDHPETRWYEAYALVVAADWLQGPYLFSLYRDEYNLAPNIVLNLYLTDFATTALGAGLVGFLADRHGRKLFCMVYCVAYAISCLLTVAPGAPLPFLFLGRVLGGLSTAVLAAIFDAWMVTNFRERGLADQGCDLTRTYAASNVVNSAVAIAARLGGGVLVAATGSRKSPFLVSVVLLWFALQAIWSRWVENFGGKASPKSMLVRPSVWSVLKMPTVLALAFASTMFEGAMNLFVFYWNPTLGALRPGSSGEPPYGLVYSSFMAASMAASLAFNIVMDRRVVKKYARLAAGTTAVAALCAAKLASAKTEGGAFWLFCLLQACIGMFTPCVGYLKARLIDDDARATVYSVTRIPFNILVIVSLLASKDNSSISGVFTTCALMLTSSLTIMWAGSLQGMP